MTNTPTFDDLTPPDEVIMNAFGRCLVPPKGAAEIARWGARHGWEQARKTQQWPVAIDGLVEPPEEKDGDVAGRVQYQAGNGLWGYMHWREAAAAGLPWLHTPRWLPRPEPTLQEAVDTLAEEYPGWRPDLQAVMRRALEQAGEGKA